MNEDLQALEIRLEELSHLTGLAGEVIQEDRINEHFRFYLLPKFLRPYRYFIYAGFAIVFIPILLQILVIAIVLPVLVLIFAVVIGAACFPRGESKYRGETFRKLGANQQNALKSLILQAQEHNILIREIQKIDQSIALNHGPNETNHREIAIATLSACRKAIVEALVLEHQYRENWADVTKSWVTQVLPLLIAEMQTDSVRQGTSEAIDLAADQLLSDLQVHRENLRAKLDDQKLHPLTHPQQITAAKLSPYGKVINLSLQILLNVQREIGLLLN